ncbi:helicase-associated domain-containing protein [Treponema sp. Marseille-Q4130]|uniref:helicase-associated domain-containing protein n=1 Tax=Treponema sp. Marseille-Q4130 TaxID=2766702 RepID=UPI001652B0A5|nr:helicase-associated domain-containing protein [Treponema sp. Marseille-Q4130]MBC6721305.1 helicase-associated domain-containing protein [Treponema sp. Marseille-Q4130]
MLNESDKKRRTALWQASLAMLPDSRFFDMLRAYLGKIKTPYNKQNLIEQLSSFFCREQNRKNLLTLLDDFDEKIITALVLVPEATEEKLICFFSGEYTSSEITARLSNLTDRLIIYKDESNKDDPQRLYVNPLLEDLLAPRIDIARIIPEAQYASRTEGGSFSISPEFIAAVISYIAERPDLCKADGSLKKIDAARLETVFACGTAPVQTLITALLNLSLVKRNESGITVDYARSLSFAELPPEKQYAYLTAASSASLDREGLRSYAELILDIAASVPDSGLTKRVLLRCMSLLGSSVREQRRFRALIDRSHGKRDDGSDVRPPFERIVDAAETFGLFTVAGKTKEGDAIYRVGKTLSDEEKADTNTRFLSINSGFTVTLLPGLSLKALLPLSLFLRVVNFDTTVEFEIDKASVIRAFDFGYTAETISSLLEKYAAHGVPQNLRVSIEDWQQLYSSAVLYKGYVLKLDEKNSKLIEKNPKAARFIQTKLAEGVYLLNIRSDEDAAAFGKEAGFDCIGKIKTDAADRTPPSFPPIGSGEDQFKDVRKKNACRPEKKQRDKLLSDLHRTLASLDLSKAQKENLSARIDSKIILSAEQLGKDTVRSESAEAGGMDFLGKVRLVESAIASGDMIEVRMPKADGSAKLETILCTPLSLAKASGDAEVTVHIEATKKTATLSVGGAANIKLIKTSIF